MKRQSYSSQFKAKVALEAIREHRTSAELSSAFGIHGSLITRWKRDAVEKLPDLFAGKKRKEEKDSEALIASLYQEIGRLKMELDWVKKKSSLF